MKAQKYLHIPTQEIDCVRPPSWEGSHDVYFLHCFAVTRLRSMYRQFEVKARKVLRPYGMIQYHRLGPLSAAY